MLLQKARHEVGSIFSDLQLCNCRSMSVLYWQQTLFLFLRLDIILLAAAASLPLSFCFHKRSMMLVSLYNLLFKVCTLLIIIAHWNTLYKMDVKRNALLKMFFIMWTELYYEQPCSARLCWIVVLHSRGLARQIKGYRGSHFFHV